MRTFNKILIFALLALASQPVGAQINFALGSSFKYLKGNATTATPAEIMAPTFDDSAWPSGVAPFRYGKGAAGTVLSDMRNLYTTFFLRTTFTAENVERIKQMTFTVNYDDAFVIVVNGKTALSTNVPTPLTTTSLALVNHDPGTNENFTVNTADLGLINGSNTIAIMVLNLSLNSTDIYFDLQMSATPEVPSFDYNSNVQFSRQGGFCSEAFDLTLDSPLPDCNILYTLDGSDPKTSSSAIRAGIRAIVTVDPNLLTNRAATPGFMVRASLSKPGYKTSNSVTNTYLFLNKVKSQAYPGGKWPSAAVNGQILDYAMASDVVNSTTYGPYLDKALKQIPSICIATDNENLFSAGSGIYVNADQSGTAWERPCSIELIDTSNIQKFQINAGIRMRGAASKEDVNPKHAFRLFFREEYGANKLYYPLFGNEGADEFDRMDLRCEQNYSWSKDGSPYNSLIADIFSRDLQGKMGQPYKRGRYYHLYLNGMYWGIFQTDERAEAHFAETYLGGNSEDYDIVKVNSEQWPYYDEVTDGYINTWSALWSKCITGFDTNVNYFSLLGKKADGTTDPDGKVWVDVDNLIDYMLVIFYTGNFDAPVSRFYSDDMPNNFYGIYNRNDKTTGFRFLAHDSEHSLFVNALYGDGLQENRVNLGSSGKMSITKMTDFNPQWLHFKMSKNAEYRQRFFDRAYQQLNLGGLLNSDTLTNLYKSRASQIDYAIIAESARWGDSKTSPSLTKATWLTLLQSMYNQFFPQRSNILKQQLTTEGLYTTMLAPDVQVDGTTIYSRYLRFFGMKSVKLIDQSALAGGSSMYYTTDGTDPRVVGGGISSVAQTGKGTIEMSINQTTVLNARVYKGGVWGPLRRVLFSSADEDYSMLKVTELNYHPKDSILTNDTIDGDDFEFIEFKNSGSRPIDLSGLRLDSAINYSFPNEQLLAPGAFFVVASKPNIFFSKYNRYPSGNFSKNLSNGGEEVVLFNKSNQPVLSFTYDDAFPWPGTPDGEGYTLTAKLQNPNGNPNDPDYWMASSTLNGSPFADDLNAFTSTPAVLTEKEVIRVYPNPTSGQFYVNVTMNPNDQPYQVSIFDLSGKKLLQRTCHQTVVFDLNRENVQEGAYLVRIQTGSMIQTRKIIYIK